MNGWLPGGMPVVLVDDDPSVLFSAATLLRSAGIEDIERVSDSRELLPLLKKRTAAIVILDLSMPYISGMELLPDIIKQFPEIPVLVMTAAEDVHTAVECMKQGASDFLVKPVEETRFLTSIQKAMELRSLRNQVGALKRSLLSDRLEQEQAFLPILTTSRKMRAIFQYMESVANSEEPVLISGETGVGKELIAQALHHLSGRKGRMVAINVAGLEDAMVSDTLFGHRKGAFSSADDTRKGLIAEANGGTLFLDEIGDLGTTTQVKLLRVLQERKYYPLGSDAPLKCNARILCATNRNLQKQMDEGRFRSDLYYRLLVHHVEVPPLRDRKEDIPLLTRHFLEEAAESMEKTCPTPPPELFTLLTAYPFPGNIRQLRATLYDAVARHRSGILSLNSFRKLIGTSTTDTVTTSNNTDDCVSGLGLTLSSMLYQISGMLPSLKEMEQCLIEESMRRANNNQGIAAGFLGISRQALNQRLRKK